MLKSANLRQQVQERIRRHGHILDLVISRDDDNLIEDVSVSSVLSDYFLIVIDLALPKQSVSAKSISNGKYKSIDKMLFLLNGASLLWYSIHQRMLIIWRISIILY